MKLCPVCGLVMDQWLADNGYTRHLNCLDKPTRLEKAGVVRPYIQDGAPSAGYSGTDTSRDAEPIRAASQKTVYAYVARREDAGATVQEAREGTGLHHGVTSGALSVLHKKGHLARLLEKRGRCRVYVLPEHAQGRACD